MLEDTKNLFKSASIDVKKIHCSIEDRIDLLLVRADAIENINRPIVKRAFDTRRINQETEYNPRHNIQNYHRSEPFISKDSAESIKNLFKIKSAVDSIKKDFIGDPDWLDSYSRLLSVAVDRILRVEQKDMDFFQPQFNYINELLYLRYRLGNEDIVKLNEEEIKNIILDKDEKLIRKSIYNKYDNFFSKKSDVNNELLINKLFGDVRASKDNPEVERTITITIKDSINNFK